MVTAAPRLTSPAHAHLASAAEPCWCCGRPMARSARRCHGCGVPAMVRSRPAVGPRPRPVSRASAWRSTLACEVAPSVAAVTLAVSSVVFTTLSVLSC